MTRFPPEIPVDGLVHRLFESQVERTPRAVALIDGDRKITYGALNERANSLAATLITAGVGPDSLVGVCCDRSADMIAALLAILKAGGAYVPLDPAYPDDRIEFIRADAKLSIVLTQSALAHRFANSAVRAVRIDAAAPADALRATDPRVRMTTEDAFCVLFTSGSTGRPKGVVIPHRAVWNRLEWAERFIPYAEGELACARTTLGFVDSVAEIFAPLVFGVPLVIIGQEAQRDPAAMIAALRAESVTRIVLVPSLLSTLFEVHPNLGELLPRLRWWFLGGEAVPVALVDAFKRIMPGRKLVNLYGATEVSGDATTYDFDDMPAGMKNSPIGVPLIRSHVRILDESLRELPGMETGEVCVSGACLARGYLDRPEMTAAKFAENPFPEGGRLYRTGDLGRKLPDGAIECLGRIDSLVKIRGMRVELGEVESRLRELAGVGQAVAVAQEDEQGRKTLVAFLTAEAGADLAEERLRAGLSRVLPDYMVPSRIVRLDALPINANGKVDRRALKERRVPVSTQGAIDPPIGEVERSLAAIWDAVLGCGPVGRFQNFYDLGGHSLAAVRILGAVQDQLGQKVPVIAMFRHPTIAAFAAYLTEARGGAASAPAQRRHPIVVTGRPIPRTLPLSHYQFSFWFFHALTRRVNVVSEVFGFPADADLETLQSAYSETVAEFDVLWMRFRRWTPVQSLAPRRPSRFALRDLRGSEVSDADALQQESEANNSMPFEIGNPPHAHARLVVLPSGDRRLLVAIPHLVADLASLEIFRRALQDHYERLRAPRAKLRPEKPAFASLYDLIDWERSPDRVKELESDVRYWSQLARGSALNPLPGRLFTNKRAGRRARAFSERELPREWVDALAAFSRRRAVSLPITLAGVLSSGLARAVQLDDLNLLMMLEKRDRTETQGLFANQASMMRVRLEGCRSGGIEEAIERAGAQLLKSYEHTDGLMKRPTLLNHFWTGAPRSAIWAVGRLSAGFARLWPKTWIDPELLAQNVFAFVPYPGDVLRRKAARWTGREPGFREILIALNFFPEIYEPEPAAAEGFKIARKRSLEQVLRPSDLVINGNPMLDLTLQIHLSRNERGLIAVNLYGGAVDQEGLDEINDCMLDVMRELVGRETESKRRASA